MKAPLAPQPDTFPRAGSILPRAPAVILDTQVVLDWLLFDDPGTAMLAQAVREAQLIWLATPAMRAELADVLTRPVLARWRPDPPRLLASMDTLASIRNVGAATVTPAPPQCRDPDDQIFVDAALAFGASCLFSRDKALLALSGPLRHRGVQVLRPRDWAGPDIAGV